MLEVFIVIVLSCFLLCLFLPSLFLSLHTVKADALSQQLLQSIQLARTSAITSGSAVTLCASTDLLKCGNEWSEGQLVVNEGGERLFVFKSSAKGRLQWHSALGRPYLHFLSDGNTDFSQGAFSYFPSHQDHPLWKIIVNSHGRARLLRYNMS